VAAMFVTMAAASLTSTARLSPHVIGRPYKIVRLSEIVFVN